MDPPGQGLQLLEVPLAVEASLWRRYRLEGKQAFREALFNRYLGLARKIAIREFMRRPAYGLEKQDFMQLAFSGLLEAIDRFDPMTGTPFGAYALKRIRGAVADGLHKSSEDGAHYSFHQRRGLERLSLLQADAPETEDTDYVGQLADLALGLAIGAIAESAAVPDSDSYGSVAWREMQNAMKREIRNLPPQERLVMEYHYHDGIAFTQIADLIGVSRSRISQIHKAAILRLRLVLKRYD